MTTPLTITATMAVWIGKDPYYQRELSRALEQGKAAEAINTLTIYGTADRKTFGDWIRMGDADVTVRLIPKDEMTRRAVLALQQQLAEERAKWHERQQAILAEIQKLQALPMADVVEVSHG